MKARCGERNRAALLHARNATWQRACRHPDACGYVPREIVRVADDLRAIVRISDDLGSQSFARNFSANALRARAEERRGREGGWGGKSVWGWGAVVWSASAAAGSAQLGDEEVEETKQNGRLAQEGDVHPTRDAADLSHVARRSASPSRFEALLRAASRSQARSSALS